MDPLPTLILQVVDFGLFMKGPMAKGCPVRTSHDPVDDRRVELAEVVDAGGGHDPGEFGGHFLHPLRDGVGTVPQERHQVTPDGDRIGSEGHAFIGVEAAGDAAAVLESLGGDVLGRFCPRSRAFSLRTK